MAEVFDELLPGDVGVGLLVGPGDAVDQCAERDAEDSGGDVVRVAAAGGCESRLEVVAEAAFGVAHDSGAAV